MELLKSLYKIYSPSGSERKMKRFIRRWVNENVKCCATFSDNAGNLYCIKGYADNYPCVVAHLDQVQRLHSKDFTLLEGGGAIFGYSPSNKRQEGLGADDKNGIWVALKCLQKYDVMKCAFFVQEEVGCVGSSQADMSFFDDCRYVLQCDRRNGSDLITNVWCDLASADFVASTNYDSFGYRPTRGAMTDVATLNEQGLNVSALNMSCGYYNPHTDNEFTVVAELENCLRFVENIIENCCGVYTHTQMQYAYDDEWYNYEPSADRNLDDFIESEAVWYGDDYKMLFKEYGEYFPGKTLDDFRKSYEKAISNNLKF